MGNGLAGSLSAAAVPRLLSGSKAAALTATLSLAVLALSLTRTRSSKAGTAVRPVAIATVTGVAAMPGIAAVPATTARSHPVATATAAELVAGCVASAARLPDGEVGRPTLFLLTLDTWQRRTDQWSMHGTILDVRCALVGVLVEHLRSDLRRGPTTGRGRLPARNRLRRHFSAGQHVAIHVTVSRIPVVCRISRNKYRRGYDAR